ncbi:MAG: hypothetical protein OEW00_05245 [candidate division Zixibacteria bacterium]|nr:hypothetical protein [candidate division Zixibacteria bacterium]
MNDSEYELIQRSIDGDLTPEEKLLLDECLRKDPEAARLANRLRGLTRSLADVQRVEVPGELKSAILSRIAARRRTTAVEPVSLWDSLRNLKRFFAPDYGWAFALGAVSAAIALTLALDWSPNTLPSDSSQLRGTIGLSDSFTASVEVSRKTISLPQVSASLAVAAEPGAVLVQFQCDSPDPVRMEFIFDAGDLAFASYDNSGFGQSALACEDNRLQLTSTGANKYTVRFDDNTDQPSDIILKIYSPELIHQETFPTQRKTDD